MEQSKKNITNVDALASERERNLAKENGETQQTNITDENMKHLDDLQPSEKDVVQREDISNAPTQKCLENVGFEFEKYVDVEFLQTNGLLLDNCRGQSFDNAANMSGRYNGVHALLIEKNKFADYVPCAAHSLNLVGSESVKVATEIVNFFGLVQQIYVFFSASTRRWELLNREIKLKCTVKCLKQTRWSRHYDAVETLKDNYDNIMNILKTFSDNENEKIDFRKEAVNLYNKLTKLETAILIIFWEEILERFNSVNKKLQTPGLDICEGNKLIMSLKTFISNVRHESDKKLNEYQDAAKKLSPSVEAEYSDVNKRRVISKFSDKSTEKAVYGTEKFKRDTLIVALDKLIFDLNRSQVHAEYSKNLKFLMDLQDQSKDLESVRAIID
ncbi:zinc finger MYM-type protein 1 [Trichonephila clavipes]|nr:zinc finger MYM-type protein 1 [Trichonephila clavipes]